mmetsp:Transcript_10971/g.10879  ORF Transcript_10971/g.10879 Transcript_10971/m.10879 type:complete len:227 (-) Transcript_10971:40-720(-)
MEAFVVAGSFESSSARTSSRLATIMEISIIVFRLFFGFFSLFLANFLIDLLELSLLLVLCFLGDFLGLFFGLVISFSPIISQDIFLMEGFLDLASSIGFRLSMLLRMSFKFSTMLLHGWLTLVCFVLTFLRTLFFLGDCSPLIPFWERYTIFLRLASAFFLPFLDPFGFLVLTLLFFLDFFELSFLQLLASSNLAFGDAFGKNTALISGVWEEFLFPSELSELIDS